MPQISQKEFERLPLRAHQFLAGVPLHDVWAVDLPSPRAGITLDEFLRCRERATLHALAARARAAGPTSSYPTPLRVGPPATVARPSRRLPTGSPMPIGRDRSRQLAFARGQMSCFASSIGSRTKNSSN